MHLCQFQTPPLPRPLPGTTDQTVPPPTLPHAWNAQDYAEPLTHVHFRAEGDVEFRSILYIPKNSPYEFYDKYYEKSQHGLKLYVRRVFISDDMTELIPRCGG